MFALPCYPHKVAQEYLPFLRYPPVTFKHLVRNYLCSCHDMSVLKLQTRNFCTSYSPLLEDCKYAVVFALVTNKNYLLVRKFVWKSLMILKLLVLIGSLFALLSLSIRRTLSWKTFQFDKVWDEYCTQVSSAY